jgi:hypothetical protein
MCVAVCLPLNQCFGSKTMFCEPKRCFASRNLVLNLLFMMSDAARRKKSLCDPCGKEECCQTNADCFHATFQTTPRGLQRRSRGQYSSNLTTAVRTCLTCLTCCRERRSRTSSTRTTKRWMTASVPQPLARILLRSLLLRVPVSFPYPFFEPETYFTQKAGQGGSARKRGSGRAASFNIDFKVAKDLFFTCNVHPID